MISMLIDNAEIPSVRVSPLVRQHMNIELSGEYRL